MSDTAVSIIHTLTDGTIEHLPLVKVSIDAVVVDASAHVVVSHSFENDSDQATGRAKYVFPVPASATVCAFEMETSNGNFIIGEVKEKSEAEAQYMHAIRSGQTAGIVNWAGDDIFSISVGSIHARTSVLTRTTFVMSLMVDSRKDEIRLHLPMAMSFPRYGELLLERQDADMPGAPTRFHLSASIQTSGRLLDIHSPSHKGQLDVSPYSTHRQGTPSRHRAIARLQSTSFLPDDFVLIIRAEGLDRPRCFAEVDPQSGTIALQLMVAPEFNILRPPEQEYLFLVDRSGSMTQEDRIETAKQALKLLLNILPIDGSYMNIFSFGSNCDGLWPMSHSYSLQNIQVAKAHVERMLANMGGTEIADAIDKVIRSRNTSIPTIVYILTDGWVEQLAIDPAIQVVAESVRRASQSRSLSPLRVFTLGIGNQVSTALCEDVARAGRGISLFAANSSEIAAKCARLVGAGINPAVADITVDWTATLAIDSQISISGEIVSGVMLQPLPPILQSPPQLPTMYRNHRYVVYAILRSRTPPRTVILRGTSQDGLERSIELPVSVKVAKRFSSLAYSSAFLHTLAARNVVRDIREHQRVITPYAPDVAEDDIRRAEIIRLGIKYQLASEFTSFVRLDDGRRVAARQQAWRERRRNRSRQDQALTSSSSFGILGSLAGAAATLVNNTISWAFGGITSFSHPRAAREDQTPRRSMSLASNHSRSSRRPYRSDRRPDSGEGEGYSTDDTVSTLSSLESYSSVEVLRPTRRRRERQDLYPAPRDPSPDVHAVPTTGPMAPELPVEDLRLTELLNFDGSCPATIEVMGIMGRDAAAEAFVAAQLEVAEEVWTTVLAVQYLEHVLQCNADLLDELLVKMLEFINRKVGRARYEELRVHARESIARL